MYKLYNDLLGSKIAGETIPYFGYDSQIALVENLKKMPEDWYYKDKKLVYKFNSFGHRCEEFSNIQDDYILFLGDSNTVGIGLELENTYPYLISQKLNLPYYNLSLGGSGIDSMFYNYNIWINQFPKPKLIVFYWSHNARFLLKTMYHEIFASCNVNTDDREIKNMIKYASGLNYFYTKTYLFSKLIKSSLNNNKIPNYHVSFFNEERGIDVKIFNPLDKARDNIHPGLLSHQLISEYIVTNHSNFT